MTKKWAFFTSRNGLRSPIFYFWILPYHIKPENFYCRRKYNRHRRIPGRIKFVIKKIKKWDFSMIFLLMLQVTHATFFAEKCCLWSFQQMLIILCMYTQRHTFFIKVEFWLKISIIFWGKSDFYEIQRFLNVCLVCAHTPKS